MAGINSDGSITYVAGRKTITIPYEQIQSPETTNKGKRGKHSPFGWVEKPGVHKYELPKVETPKEEPKKEKKKKKDDEFQPAIERDPWELSNKGDE